MYTLCSLGNFYFYLFINFFPFTLIIIIFETFLFLSADENSNIDIGAI